jgi:hypothetical protein
MTTWKTFDHTTRFSFQPFSISQQLCFTRLHFRCQAKTRHTFFPRKESTRESSVIEVTKTLLRPSSDGNALLLKGLRPPARGKGLRLRTDSGFQFSDGIITDEASNFGPLFQKGLLSSKRVLQKNEENKSCGNYLDLQIRFC